MSDINVLAQPTLVPASWSMDKLGHHDLWSLAQQGTPPFKTSKHSPYLDRTRLSKFRDRFVIMHVTLHHWRRADWICAAKEHRIL